MREHLLYLTATSSHIASRLTLVLEPNLCVQVAYTPKTYLKEFKIELFILSAMYIATIEWQLRTYVPGFGSSNWVVQALQSCRVLRLADVLGSHSSQMRKVRYNWFIDLLLNILQSSISPSITLSICYAVLNSADILLPGVLHRGSNISAMPDSGPMLHSNSALFFCIRSSALWRASTWTRAQQCDQCFWQFWYERFFNSRSLSDIYGTVIWRLYHWLPRV
eukprot:SAG11_NODE_7058_length_1201_cov_1.072595_1_plen_220_part_01